MTTEITNETAMTISTEASESPTHALVALSAVEMSQAKAGIQTFLRNKLHELAHERDEAQSSLDAAKKHKWKHSSFVSLLSRIKQKELYYGKLLAASEAGYAIIPNMEMQVFAIRVKREKPVEHAHETDTRWTPNARVDNEDEQRLALGEGRYENPSQLVTNKRWDTKEIKDGKEVVTHHHLQRATDFAEMEFPLAVAHPLVMDATARTMAFKIFDRVGIVTDARMTTRGKDPIVLGQIRMKEAYGYRTASFLIAWYLDPRTL